MSGESVAAAGGNDANRYGAVQEFFGERVEGAVTADDEDEVGVGLNGFSDFFLSVGNRLRNLIGDVGGGITPLVFDGLHGLVRLLGAGLVVDDDVNFGWIHGRPQLKNE